MSSEDREGNSDSKDDSDKLEIEIEPLEMDLRKMEISDPDENEPEDLTNDDEDKKECEIFREVLNAHYLEKRADPTTDMKNVAVVMYINTIGEIDNVNKVVFVDFNVSFYWRDDINIGTIFALNLEKMWKHDIEIINSVDLEPTITDDSNYWVNLNWSPYGITTCYQRYKGNISVDMDLHSFPFDLQDIIIQMKSTGSAESDFKLINRTKPANLEKMSKEIDMIEWYLRENIATVETKFWSNHEERNYSELDAVIKVERKPGYYVTKICGLILMLVMMSWVVYFMDCSDLPSRTGVLFTLFLAAVAFQFVVGSTIPRTSYFTLMDKFIFVTYVFLCWPVVESVIVEVVDSYNYSSVAKWIDWISLIVSVVCFLAVSLFFTFFVAIRRFTHDVSTSITNLV